MIKPQRLKKGDKVAIVSLSAGTLGEKWAIHRYYIAKERLENDFFKRKLKNLKKVVDKIWENMVLYQS